MASRSVPASSGAVGRAQARGRGPSGGGTSARAHHLRRVLRAHGAADRARRDPGGAAAARRVHQREERREERGRARPRVGASAGDLPSVSSTPAASARPISEGAVRGAVHELSRTLRDVWPAYPWALRLGARGRKAHTGFEPAQVRRRTFVVSVLVGDQPGAGHCPPCQLCASCAPVRVATERSSADLSKQDVYGQTTRNHPGDAKSSGGGGIRTHETLARLAVFKTAPFGHSGTPPCGESSRGP